MPGTELLHSLDEALQADHPGTVSPEKLARSMRKAEIPRRSPQCSLAVAST